ncbi:hypothetical protein CRYUN_Cryun13aG0019800 [Craigia yunnanensis]
METEDMLKKKKLELDGAAGHDAGIWALIEGSSRREPRTRVLILGIHLMEVNADYSNSVLTICIVYTSTEEILQAIQKSREEKRIGHVQEIYSDDHGGDQNLIIKLVDLEKHMYVAIAPDPDFVIRTGGEKRLSNFLLWQCSCSHL